jgi:hypothetical protein
VALMLAIAPPASAHWFATGLGPIYDGISHVLLTPECMVPVIGLALLAGLRGPEHGRWALFIVTGACLLGAELVSTPPAPGVVALQTAALCLVLGGLVAADLHIPLGVTATLAAIVGVVGGASNAAAHQVGAGEAAVVGVCVTVFVLTALTASVIVPLRIPWLRVTARVLGSWLAALGLLLAGWSLRVK